MLVVKFGDDPLDDNQSLVYGLCRFSWAERARLKIYFSPLFSSRKVKEGKDNCISTKTIND